MNDRLKALCALSLTLCVVAVLLFPAVTGSFTASNGPATALRALQACLRMHTVMHNTFQYVAARAIGAPDDVSRRQIADESQISQPLVQPATALRC